MADITDIFHPATGAWFRMALGTPTPPQVLGWPEIADGRNCLILSPTGSGKTLAAFLAGIDMLLQMGLRQERRPGVQILYISPLKALNYDIERNLRLPLEGVASEVRRMGLAAPEITMGVRTGDTPSNERAKMLRKPPHILITTPESLNLILTSRAAAMLTGVQQVIVDEVHSLAPNKRGAFLSVLLERLEDIAQNSPVRIGLSATQRPLEEVARFLGGYDSDGNPRPVSIIDASQRKDLQVTVTTAVPDFNALQAGQLWPEIENKLLGDISCNRSTIIFANNRRMVERLALNLNERAEKGKIEPHHGSISPARRKDTEERLKSGELSAVVATSTLELGIDMGSVDLVCQIQSPKTVSGGLQRVGRAGHLHGQTSKGRIYTTSFLDLLEATVISRCMLDGEVEEIRAVENPLDVLAQQIAAMAARGPVATSSILATMRRTAAFHSLPEEVYWQVVEMVSGRMGRSFPARISLDRLTNEVSPLPGTLRAVVTSGGVIPDTGQFPIYLTGTRLSVGELDEEFVWEAREGEAFRLGTSQWRIDKIEADRIFVHPTAGVPAKVPFWRGELLWRHIPLGQRIGQFLDEAEKIEDVDALAEWIRQRAPTDRDAARNLAKFIDRQRQTGALPTDRRIVVEFFTDSLGEGRLAVITTYGNRVHQALRIALVELFREETGVSPESMASDDGVLVRLTADSVGDLGFVRKLTAGRFRELLDRGLVRSPLFGMRFRQNAARALLITGSRPGKRSPLWLQRLKAKDVLQAARAVPGFPIVAETARECKRDYFDADFTASLLDGVAGGSIELVSRSSSVPSPFASSMEFLFKGEFMYVWDRPVGEATQGPAPEDIDLAALAGSGERAIDPAAVARLREEVQRLADGTRARTAAEMAEILRELGDLTTHEFMERTAERDTTLLEDLRQAGRITLITIRGDSRWVLAEGADEWQAAAAQPGQHRDFWQRRAVSYLETFPAATPGEFALRYGLGEDYSREVFEAGVSESGAVQLGSVWMLREHAEAARRITLAIRRRESRPVSQQEFQAFVFRWQHRDGSGLGGREGVLEVIEQLAGQAVPADLWESEVLSRRVHAYNPQSLDLLLSAGQVVWCGVPGTGRPGSLILLPRSLLNALPAVGSVEPPRLSALQREVLQALQTRGASFLLEVALELGKESARVEKALRELIWTGEVTQDGFNVFRRSGPAQDLKSAASGTFGSPRQRFQQLKRLKPAAHPSEQGRWSALPSNAGQALDEDAVELVARLLLDRYGVLTRDLAARSSLSVSWSALYRALERMELSGEIQRGYYIQDMGGAQFALHEAARSLREQHTKDKSALLVNTFDPAIVIDSPWTRRSGSYAVFVSGSPVLLYESGGRRLRPLASEAESLDAVRALSGVLDCPWPLRPVRRVEVEFWGDQEVANSAVEQHLRESGFERTPRGLVLKH